ncbi:hypothetical protein V8C86DRAFT_2609971, partial [Haematococcus lacustris]
MLLLLLLLLCSLRWQGGGWRLISPVGRGAEHGVWGTPDGLKDFSLLLFQDLSLHLLVQTIGALHGCRFCHSLLQASASPASGPARM